jgi:hypothetical protein
MLYGMSGRGYGEEGVARAQHVLSRKIRLRCTYGQTLKSGGRTVDTGVSPWHWPAHTV